ncbi:hypothetical protein [Herbaspirillum rubrisubalbicans]|uniref:hypothetical protein n=1 Tax=Herbaspirillum rubrisubalbicans TaxID=80842 RepID=UPI00073A35C1|nr:hypothetical protein [Herbaspirillum rubrisubalbicans]
MGTAVRGLTLAEKYRVSNELAEEVALASARFSVVSATLTGQTEDPLVMDLRDIGTHIEHFTLDIRLAMVVLEGCAEDSRLQRFAAARVIHSLFELKLATDRWFFKKVRDFAFCAGLAFDFPEIKQAREQFARDLKVIDSWASIRNLATGHYDSDAVRVAEALESIDVDMVRRVADAQLGFLLAVMDAVRTLFKARWGNSKDHLKA